ncbi:hypothetical protein MMC30_009237 [Trapelia coarctata]|nr:hypothetical protein [Trapelia coarctata]
MSETGQRNPSSPQRTSFRRSLKPEHPSQAGPNIQSAKTRPARRGPLIIGGLAIYCFTAYVTYLYYSASKTPPVTQEANVPDDVSDRYNETAQHFDSDVDFTEKAMGLGWLRKSLAKRASGHVLEVSVGTGRNARYYDLKRCKSITFVDQSPEMVEIAKRKFYETHPAYKKCRFLTQSAQNPIPRPAPGGFDTVIQTMGLCSTPHPAALLKHLAKLTNPTHGRILLLEHGRSHYAWLNRILDNNAPAHADKHGCWWNKDIQRIVEESELEVIEIKRYHLGTTCARVGVLSISAELSSGRCDMSGRASGEKIWVYGHLGSTRPSNQDSRGKTALDPNKRTLLPTYILLLEDSRLDSNKRTLSPPPFSEAINLKTRVLLETHSDASCDYGR